MISCQHESDLWSRPFDGWTDEDWGTCGLSVLWNIKTGQVLWAEGAHKVDDMSQVGRPIEEFSKERGKVRLVSSF